MGDSRRERAAKFTQRYETETLLNLARDSASYAGDQVKADQVWITTKHGQEYTLQAYITDLVDDIIYSLEFGNDFYRVTGIDWDMECGFYAYYVHEQDPPGWKLFWNDDCIGMLYDIEEYQEEGQYPFQWSWE